MKMKNKVIGGFAIAVGVSSYINGTASYDDFKDKTLREFRSEPITARKGIVEGYISEADLPEELFDKIYACFSESSYTKDRDIKISVVGKWCKDAYEYDYLDSYISFDKFERQFSEWDGAYRPLEKAIKKTIGDEDSYEHVKSRWTLSMEEAPYAMVETTFRANNNLGVKVIHTVTAKVDVLSGEMISIQ
ncbi:hypothetical protein [Vibrio campbellii]|uniref:hypothetical protein n=1 Tax=Vibrio campbellii TaxID=680 RepID=UPI0021087149|nr:hypothetical protein [Vibrio campbellii]UTZ44829.1 hypothetical protein HB764_26605 [Vibrio campbellii]